MDNRQLKILLVDDDEDEYVLTKDLLGEIEGGDYDLTWTSKYEDAMEVMQNNLHDLYLVDYHLGECNGLDLLRQAIKNGCSVPIILLTGQGDREVDLKAMKFGASDYLDKGEISAKQLERCIRYTIERNRLQSELQVSEKRLRTIISSNVDGIMIMDRDGFVQFVNPAAEFLLGCSSEELIGRQYEYPYESCAWREQEIVRKNGENVIVEIRVVEIDWKGDIGYLASLRNITLRKKAEEQIHLLTQQLIEAQENERQRISRELHDSVAQDLSALKIGMDFLFDPWKNVPEALKNKVSDCSSILAGAVRSIRDLAYDLCPTSLEHLGLGRAIQQYCKEFSERNDIEVDFSTAGMDHVYLCSDAEINIYRMIQESMNNVIKHANASKIVIRLVASYPSIIIRIEDDGIGFNVEKRMVSALSEKRMGLKSMEERTRFLNGNLTLHSKKGSGTKILIELSYEINDSGHEELAAASN